MPILPRPTRNLACSIASTCLILAAKTALGESEVIAPAAIQGPTKTVLFTQGTPVPGAGLPGTGIPAGAIWAGFGTPAINDSGAVAFVGRWTADTARSAGIFVTPPAGTTAQLRVKTGDPIPGIGHVASLVDPQIAADGSVLFFANVQGPTVKPENATVLLWSSSGGFLQRVVARAGMQVPSLANAAITSMTAVLANEGKVALRVNLAADARTNDLNDKAVLTWSASTGVLEAALREGESITGLGKVIRFDTLVNNVSAPGANQGWFYADSTGSTQLYARAVLSSGITHLLSIVGPFKTSLGATRAPAESGQAQLRAINLPSFRETGSPRGAFRATGNNGKFGIYHLDPITERSTLVLESGQPAPGVLNRNALTFTDPICSPDGGGSLWTARVGRTTFPEPGRVLYWAKTGVPPVVVAREGLPAADCEPGVEYKQLQSYTLPGGETGPVFTATLSGPGLLPIEDRGLFGVDSSGTARLLLREGEFLASKEVRAFQVLTATPGAQGTGRSCNRQGHIAVIAVHPDHSTTLARITVP